MNGGSRCSLHTINLASSPKNSDAASCLRVAVTSCDVVMFHGACLMMRSDSDLADEILVFVIE